MASNANTQRNKSLLGNNSDINVSQVLSNRRNKYNIKKKYIKIEEKESNQHSNNNSLDKINSNEIQNINIDKIINSTIFNKEKTKLQLFYSEHLNQKNNKNGSPKNLTQKQISIGENISKNSKSTLNNNNDYDSSIVDMGTNHDTIDNRKKKSFVCSNKNKIKKENNRQIFTNLAFNNKKGK